MIADVFDIDAEDTQGITGLIVAAAENRPDVVKLLLKHKADSNIKSKLGVSALMFASARGSDIEIVQALMVIFIHYWKRNGTYDRSFSGGTN